MTTVPVIDTHVHLRDFNQSHKETVKHGLDVARDSGIAAIFDMPNTDPPLTTRETILDRIALAHAANVPEVFYGIHLGITNDQEQVKRAAQLYHDIRAVIGMKLYAGHSVGNMGVINTDTQRAIYLTLTQEGYDGVLFVHAEKEDCMNHALWNPNTPISHCHARSEFAEIESVRDQLRYAKEANFTGKLHIAHISSPTAVDLVNAAKRNGMDVSCGVCPHHFIYDWQEMVKPDGIRMKMNPPLRKPESRDLMLAYLRAGKIDWIETDHAPHTLDEKIKAPFMSGIPGLASWPVFIEYLRFHNFPDTQIEDLVFNNAVKRFNLDIAPNRRPLVDRRGDYPWNPYECIEKEIGYKFS